jgi:hypothetical protein
MTTEDLDLMIDPELDRRLRHSLRAVAATVTEDPAPAVVRPRRSSRRRRVAIGLGLATLPLAAFGYALGSEYVDEIPPRNAFISGSDADGRYWLVPAFHKQDCDKVFPGVEMIAERDNKVGEEWNNWSFMYGDGSGPPGCVVEEVSTWLADPTRLVAHGRPSGGKPWVVTFGVHPTVTQLRVTTPDGTVRLVPTVPRPDRPAGPRYAAFTIPATATSATVSLLTADGTPVPGGVTRLPRDEGAKPPN